MAVRDYNFDFIPRKQTRRQLRLRLEGCLAERERIARELHDTFLQALQSLVLRFHAAAERIPTQEPARKLMEEALSCADRLIADGRDAIMSLRTSTAIDLTSALRRVGEELARDGRGAFELSADKQSMLLHPFVCEEAYRIGAEALVNAFRHSSATQISARIEHEADGLILRIADDGCGFDTSVDREPARRWGLLGMRERAARIQARLQIRSHVGKGTLVVLTVPRDIAYAGGVTGSRN